MDNNRDCQEKDSLQTEKNDINVIDHVSGSEEMVEYKDHESKLPSPYTRCRPESELPLRDKTNTVLPLTDSPSLYKAPFFKKISSLRWKVCFMCCAVASLSITIRQCMSMAIVCMNRRKDYTSGNTSLLNITENNVESERKEIYVEWDSETEGLVLAAYYYTFPFTPLLCGYLAGKYGAKYVTLAMTLLMCAASIVIPLVALISPAAVMVLRAFVGFGAGGLMPCLNQLLSKWAPKLERSQMTSLLNSGISIGNIITFAFSGLICEIPLLGGWPFIFYTFSAVNLLTMLIWVLIIYNSPEEHPTSNKPEIVYILAERNNNATKMSSPPWRKLLTSRPFWAILISHVCFAFILTIMGTFLPLYMKDVLKYDPASNGLLSSLPFIGRFLGAMVVGRIADKCLEKKWMSTGMVRKMFQCISMIGSAPFLIGLSFLTEEERALAVVLLVIYWILQSGTNSAFYVNHLDIAPMYAGVISGITFTCASFATLASPLMVTAINKNNTREEWQIVFSICVAVEILGAVAFCILGSGELQKWAKDPLPGIELETGQESKP